MGGTGLRSGLDAWPPHLASRCSARSGVERDVQLEEVVIIGASLSCRMCAASSSIATHWSSIAATSSGERAWSQLSSVCSVWKSWTVRSPALPGGCGGASLWMLRPTEFRRSQYRPTEPELGRMLWASVRSGWSSPDLVDRRRGYLNFSLSPRCHSSPASARRTRD